jgi:hypothetical protein
MRKNSLTVEQTILIVREQKVILDRDLAQLFSVTTKALNQAVKRNAGRFPNDFMFVLTREEKEELVTNCDRFESLKHSSVLPYAFTEHGALMAANVLNSPRAIEASIWIVRTFIKLREIIVTHKELAMQLRELGRKVGSHDHQIVALFEAIRKFMAPPPEKPKLPMGFRP